jgi:hypothetical protein
VAPSGKGVSCQRWQSIFSKMRFAATEETADPSAALARFAGVVEERAYDLLDAVGVLTLADESFEFARNSDCVRRRDYPRFVLGPD